MDDDQKTHSEDNSTHFVCKSCGGLSNNPKNCETEGCEMKDQPLEECSCEDGKHGKEEATEPDISDS